MKALRISQNVVSIVGIWAASWLGDGINASYKEYIASVIIIIMVFLMYVFQGIYEEKISKKE